MFPIDEKTRTGLLYLKRIGKASKISGGSLIEKTALITGSTAGIGREMARTLAKMGYSVLINGTRDREQAKEWLAELASLGQDGAVFPYIQGSIDDPKVRQTMEETIRKETGGLNVLINNAAITTIGRKDILDLEEKDVHKVMDINLVAPLLLTSALSKYMVSGNERDMNYIINISSISADTVSINRADYCISKAGMGMMTELFAVRLADQGVRVFEIRPGIIHTDMTAAVQDKYDALIENGLLPISRWGEPQDIAKCVESIVRGSFDYSTGQIFHLDGGFHIRRL